MRTFRAPRLLIAVAAVTSALLVMSPSVRAAAISPAIPSGWPRTLSIPKIGVSASIEDINFNKSDDYKAPYQWNEVGWNSLGPKPGVPGNSYIFGHLDSYCCPAVFWNLHQLQPGDQVRVTYPNGSTLTFRVIWQKTYANQDVPLDFIYGGGDNRALILSTCAGIFHTDGSGYDHKLVVFARLVLPGGKLG